MRSLRLRRYCMPDRGQRSLPRRSPPRTPDRKDIHILRIRRNQRPAAKPGSVSLIPEFLSYSYLHYVATSATTYSKKILIQYFVYTLVYILTLFCVPSTFLRGKILFFFASKLEAFNLEISTILANFGKEKIRSFPDHSLINYQSPLRSSLCYS